MNKAFYNIDKRLETIYKKSQGSFVGKVAVKIAGEIFLACLIALAIYIATTFYDRSISTAEENRKLDQLYISMSNDYIHSLFGVPFISIVDDNNYRNDFYVLEQAILRTVVDNSRIVAFFVTAVEEKSKIPVDLFWEEERVLGKDTYSELNISNPIVEANITGSGRYSYYVEVQETGRYGMFNNYIFGCLPYGYIDSASPRLAEIELLGTDTDKMQRENLRKSGVPNTFGVIAAGYQDTVGMIPFCDEWENAYYLLAKRRYNS